MKYYLYEVLFKDEYGICIKSMIKNPNKEQVAEFLISDMEKFNYTINDIEDIAEISIDESKMFYSMKNEKNFPILTV